MSPKSTAGAVNPQDPRIEAFITEYLFNGMNGTAAFLKAYPDTSSPRVANTLAWRLLTNVVVRQRVDAERARLAAAAEVDRAELMRQLAAIVFADPAELSQVRRVSCPACWPGKERDIQTEPDPDCLACGGDGQAQAWFADTRKLSPEGRALYLGVKVTDKGMQVLTEDRKGAREQLAKIVGAYEAHNRQQADALAALLARINSEGSSLPVVRDPDEADAG